LQTAYTATGTHVPYGITLYSYLPPVKTYSHTKN